jgi:hypothetical protein
MRSNVTKIIGTIIIVLVVLGWWGYYTWLHPDPSVGKQLAEQFGDDFFQPGSLDLLPVTENSISAVEHSFTADFLADRQRDHDAQINGESLPNESLPMDVEKSAPQISESKNGDNKSAPQITEKNVIDKYTPKFYALEQFTNNRLEQIYAAADQEYDEKSRAGTLNHAAWTQKYMQACLKLQDSVNLQFYGLVDEMEAELKANNLSTSIIEEIKQEYTASKYRKIKELLARAHGG